MANGGYISAVLAGALAAGYASSTYSITAGVATKEGSMAFGNASGGNITSTGTGSFAAGNAAAADIVASGDGAFQWGEGTNATAASFQIGDDLFVDIGNSTLGFFGATAVGQGAALTAATTTMTSVGGGADFAIQALTTTTPFGFVTSGEGESVLQTIINNQARINELEARLDATSGVGLIA